MDITKQTVAFIREHFANNSDGHDAEHSLRVYRNALAIAAEEDCDKDVVALAALLHDVDDKKLFETKENGEVTAIGFNVDVIAQAIQAAGFDDEEAAWEAFEGQTNPPANGN